MQDCRAAALFSAGCWIYSASLHVVGCLQKARPDIQSDKTRPIGEGFEGSDIQEAADQKKSHPAREGFDRVSDKTDTREKSS